MKSIYHQPIQTIIYLQRIARSIVSPLARRIAPARWKEFNELRYWKFKKRRQLVFSNSHYKYYYTEHFGLDENFYKNKTILDIGCGPRGSLEWAKMASRRVGLDPLANEYLELGASLHQMEYMDAPSEAIPMRDGECDVVCSFNSLDHVEDIQRTLNEIKRVTREGGYFLLLVEVNHPPTDCEPHTLHPDELVRDLGPEFVCTQIEMFRLDSRGVYQAIRSGNDIPDPNCTREAGILSACFRRVSNCGDHVPDGD